MQDSIPHYYLYGETEAAEELEFIHCSEIVSYIGGYGGEIKPHRHDTLHQIVMLLQGTFEAHLETSKLSIVSPVIIVIPAGHVHGFKYDESAQGQITTIPDAFMRSACGAEHAGWMTRLLDRTSTFHLPSALPQNNPVIQYLHDIDREFRHPAPGKVPIVSALLNLVIMHLARNLELQQVTGADNPHYVRIFEAFRKLVDEHYREHLQIMDYCGLLSTHERQLNRICKALIGVSPSAYIQQYLIQEVKRNLIYTRKPVAHICYELGFSDPAYFSRFFSKHAGLPPREYRSRYRDSVN